MNSFRLILTIVVAGSLGLGFPAELCAQSNPAAATATITLKENVILSESQIRLEDIARISDNNPARKNELSKLDLATFHADQPLTIERSQIEIRILLAGFDPNAIAVKGAQRVTITAPPQIVLTDLAIEQMVFDSLCRQFLIATDDLRVNLVTPVIGVLPGIEKLKQPRVELVPTPQLPLGRVQLTIRILDETNVVAARQVTFEVARRQQVVVAASSLDRMAIVTAQDLREEVRFVDAPVDRLSIEQLVGRKVNLPFRAGEMVTLRHLSQPVVEESPILIQPRDAVRLIAKKRGLTVTIPVAEALQQGRQGQLIKVRNLQSNQVVTGTVMGRGEVHVILP